MEATIIGREADPRVTLVVNPLAAILESFAQLERDVSTLAELKGYSNDPLAKGSSKVQYLSNTGVISRNTLKALDILFNVRNQAVHFGAGIDSESARKYLDMVQSQRQRLQEVKERLPAFYTRAN